MFTVKPVTFLGQRRCILMSSSAESNSKSAECSTTPWLAFVNCLLLTGRISSFSGTEVSVAEVVLALQNRFKNVNPEKLLHFQNFFTDQHPCPDVSRVDGFLSGEMPCGG
jgi:hypothetical protein